MRHLQGKNCQDMFEMDTIFEMLHREEIWKKDDEMKLEKLLTEKNEKK